MPVCSQPQGRRILLVCPTYPQDSGNGLAIRAANWLRALAEAHDVHLLILPIAAGMVSRLSPELQSLCSDVSVIQPNAAERSQRKIFRRFDRRRVPDEQRWLTDSVHRQVDRLLSSNKFDLIVVHRIYLTPVFKNWLAKDDRPCPILLDTDDVESLTRGQIAELGVLRGKHSLAARYRRESEYYRMEEPNWLRQYNRVVCCSERDRQLLSATINASNVAVVPNTVETPNFERSIAPRPFTFVFIGNLHYLPNQDAAELLAEQIIPALRRLAREAFQFIIAGSGRPPGIKRLCQVPEFKFSGEIRDVSECYRIADAAVVPLRAGGGTRIKILEAFACGCPVVSSHCGMRGITAEHEREALIADSPEDFATQCSRLMTEPHLREKLATAAQVLYRQQYSKPVIHEKISQLLASLR